jgi:hypothetical protein
MTGGGSYRGEAAMRHVQHAAVGLFCLWTLAMIVYAIIELSTRKGPEEHLAEMMEKLEAARAEHRPDMPGDVPEASTSWVDAEVMPGPPSMVLTYVGALWFFPAFFFLCVFLFAGMWPSRDRAETE